MKLEIDNINNIKYDIIETTDGNYVNITTSGESILGLCDNASRKIYIHKNLDMHTKIKTLRHELMHAILFEYGISKETYTEEQVCDLFGTYTKFVEDLVFEYFGKGK